MFVILSVSPPNAVYRAFDIRNRPRIPIPDEDPYSIAGNEIDSSASSGFGTSGIYGQVAATREQFLMQQQQQQQHSHRRSEKPPKLPPRDNLYGHHELSSMIKVNTQNINLYIMEFVTHKYYLCAKTVKFVNC